MPFRALELRHHGTFCFHAGTEFSEFSFVVNNITVSCTDFSESAIASCRRNGKSIFPLGTNNVRGANNFETSGANYQSQSSRRDVKKKKKKKKESRNPRRLVGRSVVLSVARSRPSPTVANRLPSSSLNTAHK